MPALIPAIAYFGTVGTLGAIGATFVATAASLVVGDVQQRRAAQKARDAFNRSLQDRTVMTSLADGVRSRVYGEARNVDGVLYKAAHGTDNRYYSLILAICDAPTAIESVQAVYFNDVPVTLDGSGWVQTAPWAITERVSTSQDITLSGGAGNVTLSHTPISGTVTGSWTTGVGESQASGTVTVSLVGLVASVSGLASSITTVQVSYQYDAVRTYARVRTYLGGAAQDLHTDFADLPDITTTDKFAGIAVARVDLEYSQDAFPAGLPQISFVVRGTKCLDPRTSTTAWTQNPAIIARDWSLFTYGGGITSAAYNDTYGNASANACDVDATFTTGGTPVVMDTYQAGIVCRLDASPQQWLEAMVEAMAGRWGWAGGKLCLQAGTYRAPSFTITEDWITDKGAITVTKDVPVADMANGYRPTIANRDNGYVVEPMPELAPSAYVSADGQKLLREVTFEAVTSRQHALHVAGVLLRDQRQSLQLELPCNYRAFRPELFDVGNVTLPFFGFSAKPFEVLGWGYSLERGVVLQLKEIASSTYTVDAAFTGLENEDNTNLPDPSVVEQVTGLTVSLDTLTQTDGANAGRALVEWDAITDINVLQSGWVEVQYLRLGLPSSDPAYDQWVPTLVRGDRTAAYVSGLKPGGVYLFRARAINTIGARGKWSSQVQLVVNSATLGGSNLITNSSFEVDSAADGLADGWTAYSDGTTGAITRSIVTGGMAAGHAQHIAATNLGTGGGDQAGIYQEVSVAELAGHSFVLSAYAVVSAALPKVVLSVDFYNGASYLSSVGTAFVASTVMARYSITGSIPAGSTKASIYLLESTRPSAAGAANVAFDWVQFEIGAVATAYAPRADELLAGVVGTTQIAAAAATEVLTPVTSSSVTVTDRIHIPDNLNFRTVLLSNTFTPSVDCTAEVTCSGNLSFTTSSNGGNYEGALQHGIYTGSGSGTLQADVNWYTPDVGSSKNYKSQMFVTTRLALTGGASVTFSWAAAKGNSGDTVACQNLAMNVTLIKR